MLRGRPTPAPHPRLRAPIRWPCWARHGWPRPGWHRRALPDRPADGGGRCGPCYGSGRGRVAGKPGQHRSDRLGLLLRKEAASLTAQQLHLVGEPWRPRSCPSTAAAALAGGLAGRWPGPRIGVGVVHARLLARPRLLVPTAESVVRGQPKVGFVFCQDLRRGLSDHFGVKEGFGLYLFTNWIALNSPPATSVKPRSATLIAFI